MGHAIPKRGFQLVLKRVSLHCLRYTKAVFCLKHHLLCVSSKRPLHKRKGSKQTKNRTFTEVVGCVSDWKRVFFGCGVWDVLVGVFETCLVLVVYLCGFYILCDLWFSWVLWLFCWVLVLSLKCYAFLYLPVFAFGGFGSWAWNV